MIGGRPEEETANNKRISKNNYLEEVIYDLLKAFQKNNRLLVFCIDGLFSDERDSFCGGGK